MVHHCLEVYKFEISLNLQRPFFRPSQEHPEIFLLLLDLTLHTFLNFWCLTHKLDLDCFSSKCKDFLSLLNVHCYRNNLKASSNLALLLGHYHKYMSVILDLTMRFASNNRIKDMHSKTQYIQERVKLFWEF